MIRRFNYTHRHRIPQDRVAIAVHADGDVPSFDAQLNLEGLDYPANAKVFVEAYYKSSYQRFDFGAVANIVPPASRVLDQVDRATGIQFRVKIVESDGARGRIVAEVDDINGEDSSGANTRKYCILPVDFKDLGEEVWRVELGGQRPMLQVNKFEGAESFVRSDPLFVSLVYPAAVRAILHSVVGSNIWDPDGLTGWQEMWIRFAMNFHKVDPPAAESEPEDREEWVEDVVREFCNSLKTKTLLLNARREAAP